MDERRTELVLRAVECVPAGRIAPYGMLGRVTGTSARFVGRVLATHGSFVPWWRVTNVRGVLPAPIRAEAARRWDAEGIPHSGGRARIEDCAADEALLRESWEAASRDLHTPEEPG